MREITEAESLEIIHRAMSGPIRFPVPADDPLFPGQPLPWKDLLENTPVTEHEIYNNVVTATASLNPGHYEAALAESDLNEHIDANDSDTVSNFSTFLKANMAIKES